MPLPPPRPATPADQDAAGDVAYDTGFFGAGAQTYFPSRPLFRLLWTAPYFQGAGHGCFVAPSRDAATLAGYIVGARDPALYRRTLARLVLTGMWRAARPPSALPTSLTYLWRAARHPGPHAPEDRFPAHLHINLRPEARGAGLGDALLEAHLHVLRAANVPGVQLSTTTENRAALRLYRRHGFTVTERRLSALWTPWLGHPAEHVVLTLRLP
ncbi:GNAT family N-acetyltransferase (plasmid) [Deinococcus taeanensis]|uniref:GNAT family N-acetyltransferase n=1 Tax=Deinococcus taeanensis TaxID=2737050 RepID=UPI001CDCA024|nr:N-acetyltransferase [Deinococcus taeanensis]UBV44852.1 GNAT family N-acetyltransferase [Deinococcus taeanensis]